MLFFKGELKCIGPKIGYPQHMLDDCHKMGEHLLCDAPSILLIYPISHLPITSSCFKLPEFYLG